MKFLANENLPLATIQKLQDYGTLIYQHGYRPPAGVIYLRLQDFTPEEPADFLLNLINTTTFTFSGLFTVADENNIRQRKY